MILVKNIRFNVLTTKQRFTFINAALSFCYKIESAHEIFLFLFFQMLKI